MAKLTYINNTSLDGYIEDRHGAFDFGTMDERPVRDVHRPAPDRRDPLSGRRLYEKMAVWETEPALATQSRSRRSSRTPGERPTRSLLHDPGNGADSQHPDRTRL